MLVLETLATASPECELPSTKHTVSFSWLFFIGRLSQKKKQWADLHSGQAPYHRLLANRQQINYLDLHSHGGSPMVNDSVYYSHS